MKLFHLFLVCILTEFVKNGSQENVDHAEFAVEMDMDSLEANLDLSAYGIEVVRKVSSLGNVYHLKHINTCKEKRCKRDTSDSVMKVLQRHPMIHRVEEQMDLEVEAKFVDLESEYFSDDRDLNYEVQKRILEKVDSDLGRDLDEDVDVEKKLDFIDDGQRQSKRNNVVKKSESPNAKSLTKEDVEYLKLVDERETRLKGFVANDPEYRDLWQYHNSGQFGQLNPGFDMNLFAVYKAGITGRGVVVTIIDDGIDTLNPDIRKNFDPSASLDLNDPHNVVSDPRGPPYLEKVASKDGHGTLCAAVIGGEINNTFCAFGVAYNTNIGGVRMLAESMVTDLLEAYALTHNNQYIDIYSNSWGPKDTGTKTAPVTYYAKKGFMYGTSKGRNGKGSIYLFAAGNGGMKDDHCGGDGLVNSPYTIAATAVNIYGHKPAYTEECSAISITAAVGGYAYKKEYRESMDPLLITAEINNHCKRSFMGTSAATPLIAGCIALALEANPHLNWRDIQYMFAISARIPNPVSKVWQLNTAGILTSHVFGFGLLDCTAYVRNAQLWRSVGPLRTCVGGTFNATKDLKIRSNRKTRVTFQTSACENTENAIDRLEHVLIHTKIEHICRGDLTITLTSPTNTRSFLLKNRSKDTNNATISFSFLSLMNWGENPRGTWSFDIIDTGKCQSSKESETRGFVKEVVLEFFGTTEHESGIYKNRDLMDNYLTKIGIAKPGRSRILSGDEVYRYFNNQRKYFIQLEPLIKDLTKKLNNDLASRSFHQLSQLKTKISHDEVDFSNNLLYDKKHNTR